MPPCAERVHAAGRAFWYGPRRGGSQCLARGTYRERRHRSDRDRPRLISGSAAGRALPACGLAQFWLGSTQPFEVCLWIFPR